MKQRIPCNICNKNHIVIEQTEPFQGLYTCPDCIRNCDSCDHEKLIGNIYPCNVCECYSDWVPKR